MVLFDDSLAISVGAFRDWRREIRSADSRPSGESNPAPFRPVFPIAKMFSEDPHEI